MQRYDFSPNVSDIFLQKGFVTTSLAMVDNSGFPKVAVADTDHQVRLLNMYGDYVGGDSKKRVSVFTAAHKSHVWVLLPQSFHIFLIRFIIGYFILALS